MTETERIDSIDILEDKFEEFMAGLNVSTSIKAIIKVKLRETSVWIENNSTTKYGTFFVD